ncbi:Protein translocase subunit SecA, partial [Tetrabaena socialis]
MGKLYRFMGLSCAAVQSSSSVAAARAAFAADVTYVTGQELGFSFLKDNTALSVLDLTLRDEKFHFAIVDEVDSILIDESRNPMIISGRG